MSKKIDILTTLSKGIYKDDNYNVVDKQVVSMINEYYRRFKQDIEFQGRMNITILSLDDLDGDAGEDLRWKKIKEALPEVYDKDFVDFTLINCRNIQEIESSFVDHANFVYNTYNARTIVISRFEIFKNFLDWVKAQFIVWWYDTKDEWLKSRNRLSRPYFGDKSDKIEHKAALSQRWYFLLQENTWRDKNGNKHFVPNMSENYIKNCILWLDETLCGKYIPDPELRSQFKALFQNELSHRDTLNRLSLNGLTDLYINYRKKHENDDLLNTYSQILYAKHFYETAASEKVHIFRSIEIDENFKKEKGATRAIKIYKKDAYTTFYLCVDDSIICRTEPHYEDGHLLGGGQYTINPKKDDEAYNNLLKKFENEPYLTSNIITEKELLDGKKFQDLHSQMAIKCGIDVNDLPSMTTRRTDAQKYMVEKITNDLKAFGTEEVIKHYQNMSAIEKPSYYWKELEGITSPINGSTEIPIKVRMMLNIIAHNNYKKIYEDKVGKESGRWSASEHNYKDLEKNVNKQKAYGTKYWNMPYDELVKQGLWKDADNNIYTISSMRNGHIANIMDMLNTGKYQLDMSSETKEKYKDLFLDEFRIRNALKNSEPQFLSKEEHNAFHGFNKKGNDMINHPNHYAQTRIECIDAI